MPSRARKDTIPEGVEAVRHCISRCVRGGFLRGKDPHSGGDYAHRRPWIRQRIEELAGRFAVEVLGHAILENHYHLILHIRPDIVETWSDEEVVRGWLQLSSKRIGSLTPDEKRVEAELRSKKRVKLYRGY